MKDEDGDYGYCRCGCGEKTTIATQTDKKWGAVKGEPRRFISGHNRIPGTKLPHGLIRTPLGYLRRHCPTHPRSDSNGYIADHILVAERALGKHLPLGAELHHVNGVKDDNRRENLVICPDRAFHFLLHQRQRALDRCGHADWRPCEVCGEHDAPENMSPHGNAFYHKGCAARRARERRTA